MTNENLSWTAARVGDDYPIEKRNQDTQGLLSLALFLVPLDEVVTFVSASVDAETIHSIGHTTPGVLFGRCVVDIETLTPDGISRKYVYAEEARELMLVSEEVRLDRL